MDNGFRSVAISVMHMNKVLNQNGACIVEEHLVNHWTVLTVTEGASSSTSL